MKKTNKKPIWMEWWFLCPILTFVVIYVVYLQKNGDITLSTAYWIGGIATIIIVLLSNGIIGGSD